MNRQFWVALAVQGVLFVLFFIGAGVQSPLLVLLVVLAWTPASWVVGYRFQRAGGKFRSPIQFGMAGK